MSYCLNPDCHRPSRNLPGTKFCQGCGSKLLLRERYRAVKLIGQGGFGRTFLAVDEDKPFKPRCIIKQFFPVGVHGYVAAQDCDRARKAAELFEQEAMRLDELGKHPQIPELLASFQQNNRQYLVQEFIDGQNLGEVLQAEGAFNEVQIRRLLKSLLQVLEFIHSHHIIHRDIKPENIIRRSSSSDGEVEDLVLVDFGAAKFASGTALVKTGTTIGSAGYAAPEQVGGKAVFASDLYSLGITCIHLLTQIDPFDLYSFSEDAWVWRDYLTNRVGSQLGHILDRMIEKATRRRYKTAGEVLQDLSPQQNQTVVVGNAIWLTPTTPSFNSTLTALPQTQTWRCVNTLTGHAGAVLSVALSPDGQIIASSSSDDTIKLWDLQTGRLIHTFSGDSGQFGGVSSVAFSPDGRTLVSGSSQGLTVKAKSHDLIKLWDLETGRLLHTLNGHAKSVYCLAFSPDGQTLVSASEDRTIRVWHLPTGLPILTLAGHQEPIRSLAISPDGQTLASSSDDATVKIWDLATGEMLRSIAGLYPVFSVAISPDGGTVVGGGYDYTIKLWNLETGKLLCILCDHSNWVKSVTISPDGQTLVSGSNDYTIRLWHFETRRVLCTLAEHSGCVNSLVFSSDSRTLISGSADKTIRLWRCD